MIKLVQLYLVNFDNNVLFFVFLNHALSEFLKN